MSSIRQIYLLKDLTIGSLVILELIFLAYYGNSAQMDVWHFIGGDFEKFLQLSTAGSVFMLFGFLLMVMLQFRYHDYYVYGTVGWLSFALFILLIGMGLGGQYVRDKSNGTEYNQPVAFWFGQFAIYVLSLVEIYRLYAQNCVQIKKVPPESHSEVHIPVATQENHSLNPNTK
ncbi:hypothetical protein pb186bvf_016940 [Paramecium bursaria]